MPNLVHVTYDQTGKIKSTNALGMREMQEKIYEGRTAQYLLLKAPPASGKSRALMFIALDKLKHQSIKKGFYYHLSGKDHRSQIVISKLSC